MCIGICDDMHLCWPGVCRHSCERAMHCRSVRAFVCACVRRVVPCRAVLCRAVQSTVRARVRACVCMCVRVGPCGLAGMHWHAETDALFVKYERQDVLSCVRLLLGGEKASQAAMDQVRVHRMHVSTRARGRARIGVHVRAPLCVRMLPCVHSSRFWLVRTGTAHRHAASNTSSNTSMHTHALACTRMHGRA